MEVSICKLFAGYVTYRDRASEYDKRLKKRRRLIGLAIAATVAILVTNCIRCRSLRATKSAVCFV